MRRGLNSKERIISASIDEFSKNGFFGARVDIIAKKAKINKAMIFYYFSSKEQLYKQVLVRIASKTIGNLKKSGIVNESITPEEYLHKFPEVYMDFFEKNPSFLRIIGLGLIQNGDYMKSILKEMFENMKEGLPEKFSGFIKKWHREGKITEKDPAHFFLNIVSLSLFPMLSKPLSEAIFGNEFDDSTFTGERLNSIKNLLEKGMIK